MSRLTPFAAGAAVLVADQLTKHIAAETNSWISYDIGTDRAITPISSAVSTTAVLGLIAIALLAAVLVFARCYLTRVTAMVTAAGIVGNRIDQLGGAKVLVHWTTAHPAVINWISLPGGYDTNLADLAITFGFLALAAIAAVRAIEAKRALIARRQLATLATQPA